MKRLTTKLKGRGLSLLMRFLARLHCALPVAVCCAVVFYFMQEDTLQAYLRGLLFCIPASLSYYAAEKLPALWQFLVASFLISALSWLLLGHPGGAWLAALLCFLRGRRRLDEEKEAFFFDVPSYPLLLIFIVPFFVSAAQGAVMLQKLSVLSAALYFLVCLSYKGVERIDGYLTLNCGMCGLPKRRIVRISGAAAAAVVILAAALLLPAAWMHSGSLQIDLSDLNRLGTPATNPEFTPAETPEGVGSFEELLGAGRKPWFQIPPFVSYLFYTVAVSGVVLLLLYGIYQVFKNFRSSYTDSRDVVQFLSREGEGEKEAEPKGHRNRPSLFDRSPNAQIRRRYRRTILRHVSEKPESWKAPAEIEAGAGISNPLLHSLYEKARYSREGCTAEETGMLRSQR